MIAFLQRIHEGNLLCVLRVFRISRDLKFPFFGRPRQGAANTVASLSQLCLQVRVIRVAAQQPESTPQWVEAEFITCAQSLMWWFCLCQWVKAPLMIWPVDSHDFLRRKDFEIPSRIPLHVVGYSGIASGTELQRASTCAIS